MEPQQTYVLNLDLQLRDRFNKPLEENTPEGDDLAMQPVIARNLLRNALWEHRLDQRMPMHERRAVADGIRVLVHKLNEEVPQFSFDEATDLERFIVLMPTLSYAVAYLLDIFPQEYWDEVQRVRDEATRKANGTVPEQEDEIIDEDTEANQPAEEQKPNELTYVVTQDELDADTSLAERGIGLGDVVGVESGKLIREVAKEQPVVEMTPSDVDE